MLRQMSHPALQFFLADSVHLIDDELRARGIAWVGSASRWTPSTSWPGSKKTTPRPTSPTATTKPNNHPAILIAGSAASAATIEAPILATPTRNPVPARSIKAGEFHWGYGSGIVVTRVPDYGEFVLD